MCIDIQKKCIDICENIMLISIEYALISEFVLNYWHIILHLMGGD